MTCLAAVLLVGCAAEQERSTQSEAVEYNLQERYSAQCAQAGLIPGSAEFNNCLSRLER